MKITLGFKKYVEEEFDLPKKFEFIFTKDSDNCTEEEESLYYNDFYDWKREVTHSTIYDEVDTIEWR